MRPTLATKSIDGFTRETEYSLLRIQGFTPLLVLAHLNVESLPLAHGTEDGVHPVSAAALGQPFYTAAPVLG